MKKLFMFCSALSILLLTSCETKNINSDSFTGTCSTSSKNSSQATDNTYDNQPSSIVDRDALINEASSALNMENLSMTIVCNYFTNPDEYLYYILCVLSCGDVWATTYSLNSGGIDENKFFYKLYTCDDSVWTIITEPVYLGHLEINDVELLTKYFSDIDLNSECYLREDDAAPESVDNVRYTIYCYIPLEDGGKGSYHVKSYGDSTGLSYETKDVNAVSALEIIQNSTLYEMWLETHLKIN